MSTPDKEQQKSEEKISEVADLLRKKVQKNVQVELQKSSGTNEVENIIKNANNQFLLNVLSPEITANEDKKRNHKDKLLKAVEVFLGVQFLVVFILVGYTLFKILYCHEHQNPLSDETIKLIFTFLSAYITSVVVELIAILQFIVKNVFDTSIAELVKLFRDGGNSDK